VVVGGRVDVVDRVAVVEVEVEEPAVLVGANAVFGLGDALSAGTMATA
jgi:hypothetical protein